MAAFTPILALYSLEILLLVASAAAAVSLVRVPPRGRLVLWRVVVIACLLLPLAPPRIVHVDLMPTTTTARVIDPGSSTLMTSASTASIIGMIPWVVVAGALLRTVWLGIGIIRLRALSRRSRTAALSDDLRILKQALAPTAEVAWHDDLPQPVTFGARHPVVLLPSRLRDTSEECQRAVVCHELVHVERGDWPATIVEELILTALWFHPAVWWAIGQIQLNREATVDARVVGITGARRAYMEALLAFADGNARQWHRCSRAAARSSRGSDNFRRRSSCHGRVSHWRERRSPRSSSVRRGASFPPYRFGRKCAIEPLPRR